jgi:hypothetical protein
VDIRVVIYDIYTHIRKMRISLLRYRCFNSKRESLITPPKCDWLKASDVLSNFISYGFLRLAGSDDMSSYVVAVNSFPHPTLLANPR